MINRDKPDYGSKPVNGSLGSHSDKAISLMPEVRCNIAYSNFMRIPLRIKHTLPSLGIYPQKVKKYLIMHDPCVHFPLLFN